MSTDSISGMSSYDPQSSGSQVVSSTMDTMNGQNSGSDNSAITDKASFGAAVVSKTLDYMNSGGTHNSEMAQTYDFGKNVLGGAAAGLGAVTDIKI